MRSLRSLPFIYSGGPAAPVITNTNAADVPFTAFILTGSQRTQEGYHQWGIKLDFETGDSENRFEANEFASWNITGFLGPPH